MLSELLETESFKSPEERSRAVGVIHRESLRLTNLVDNILEFTRLRRATPAPSASRVALAEVVREVADSLAPLLEAGGNRLELVAETLHAALNAVAAVAPEWIKRQVPDSWYQRYRRRIEYSRRPSSERERQTKAQTIGEDGVQFLAWLDEEAAPAQLRELAAIQTLRRVWQRHYRRTPEGKGKKNSPAVLRLATKEELAANDEPIETPYDVEARSGIRAGSGGRATRCISARPVIRSECISSPMYRPPRPMLVKPNVRRLLSKP